jgi:hypothetical protein
MNIPFVLHEPTDEAVTFAVRHVPSRPQLKRRR